MKLRDQDLDATKEAKDAATEVLRRARNRPNFGNAGEVGDLCTRPQQRKAASLAPGPVACPIARVGMLY